jgi:rfaE bifunctional protein nucleotidyltransferase chain/domain
MNKIINTKDAKTISKQIKATNKTIVLSGGCFDILHIGHIKFLQNAKKQGDYLFVLLENDKTVNKLKGPNRPINPQQERAQVLAAISFVDYIVLLDEMKSNKDYDNLIFSLSPDIIATTKNDPQAVHNKRQAKKIGAKVSFVTERIRNKSTTLLAELISKNFDK